jgi:hypothetical protein
LTEVWGIFSKIPFFFNLFRMFLFDLNLDAHKTL